MSLSIHLAAQADAPYMVLSSGMPVSGILKLEFYSSIFM